MNQIELLVVEDSHEAPRLIPVDRIMECRPSTENISHVVIRNASPSVTTLTVAEPYDSIVNRIQSLVPSISRAPQLKRVLPLREF